MNMKVGPQRKLSSKKFMPSNCGAGECSWNSSLDSKIKPVNPKGNQPWIFIWRTDAKAETPILWPPDGKSWLTEKDSDAGKDWGQEEKVTTEDEVVGWHHQLNGHESEQTRADSEGQGSLACCSLWGCKESDMTEWLNNNNRAVKRWQEFGLHTYIQGKFGVLLSQDWFFINVSESSASKLRIECVDRWFWLLVWGGIILFSCSFYAGSNFRSPWEWAKAVLNWKLTP